MHSPPNIISTDHSPKHQLSPLTIEEPNLETSGSIPNLMPNEAPPKTNKMSLVSGLHFWDEKHEENYDEELGEDLRQRNVIVEILDLLKDLRRRAGVNTEQWKFGGDQGEEIWEDPVLKVVAREYSSYLINYDFSQKKLGEYLEEFEYSGDITCVYSKTDLFLEHSGKVNRQELKEGLMMTVLSILECQQDVSELVNAEHNSMGVGYALGDDQIVLVLLMCRAPIRVLRLQTDPIGNLDLEANCTSHGTVVSRVRVLHQFTGSVVSSYRESDYKEKEEDGSGPDVALTLKDEINGNMIRSTFQNQGVSFGRMNKDGYVLEMVLRGGGLGDSHPNTVESGLGSASGEGSPYFIWEFCLLIVWS